MICYVFKRNGNWWGKLRLDGEHRVTAFSLQTTDKRVAYAKLLETAKEREKCQRAGKPSQVGAGQNQPP